MRRIAIYTAAVVFAAALVVRYRQLGGPYFAIPETVQDHVSLQRFATTDAIVLSRRAAAIVPRGATVTVLQPSLAPRYEMTHALTAVGVMPRHQVLFADLSLQPQYILTIRESLQDPAYTLVAEFPEGKVYVRRP